MQHDEHAFEDDEHAFGPLTRAHRETAIPRDARLMGLDRNTEEGALLAMAGSLDSRKMSHRVVAWLLLASFALPVLYSAVILLF